MIAQFHFHNLAQRKKRNTNREQTKRSKKETVQYKHTKSVEMWFLLGVKQVKLLPNHSMSQSDSQNQ